jgi:hypothetical protein
MLSATVTALELTLFTELCTLSAMLFLITEKNSSAGLKIHICLLASFTR